MYNNPFVAQNQGSEPERLAQNLDEARRHLRALDPTAQTFCFQTFDDNEARGDLSLARTLHGSIEDCAPALIKLNSRGAGVFVTVNEVAPGKPRKTGNITRVRSLFVDADKPDKTQQVQDAVYRFGVPTSVIVETSPDKLHLYWLTTGCPLEQFKEAQTALFNIFGTDPKVKDLPRVLRLAGFIHRKGAPFRSMLHQGEPDRVYPFATLLARIKAASDPNSNVVALRPRGDAGKPLVGERPKLADQRTSTSNAAAQAGVPSPHWFNNLSAKQQNGMLRALAADPRVIVLADADRATWRDILWGFAHAETLGADEACELARQWSQTSAKYEEAPFAREWRSFDPARPNGITVATLIDAAKKVGFDHQPWRDIANGTTTVVNPSPAPALPTIQVINGLRHKAADEGLAAMRAAGVPFYQRGRDLVRVCRIPAKTSDGKDIEVSGIVPVALPLLERALGKSARWEKCNAKGDWLRIDPPQDVAKQIAAMSGEWDFPSLTGVTGTPTLRPDGSVLDTVGYDPATGLYLFAPPPMQQIPLKPSKADALAALALVDGLLDEFPFVDDASRSVGISMLLTPVLRGACPVVPLHGVDAPQSGTGKSYLADISSAIATGERCAVIAAAPKQEETEKRLIMAALSGQAIIALDNINGEIGGDFLCQVTERPLMKVRRLCSSDDHLVRNAFTVFSNGNNMTVVADLVRRTLVGRLDANMERPYDRTFKADPLAAVLADRGRYVAAVLTIARAYIAAGKPGLLPALASFKEWSDLVRSAIVWLGRADPVSTIAVTAAEDPVQQERAAVFSAWAAELPLAPMQYLTSELIESADEKVIPQTYPVKYVRPTLRDALGDVAGGRSGLGIDGKRLGKWLGRYEGVVCAGYKLAVDRSDKARPRWLLTRV